MRVKRIAVTELILGAAILMAMTPAAAIVNVAFAPVCLAVALFMFQYQKTDYLKFTLWVWMLSPLLRRIVDYNTVWHENSLIMVAPLLVTLVSGISIFYKNPRVIRHGEVPYVIFILVVFLGFFVGVTSSGLVAGFFALVNWAIPAIFALYILRTQLPAIWIAETLFNVLTRGALVLGAYGAYQFFFLPPWDAAWMTAANLGSIGAAVPGGVRVFGTLNSPGPYAFYMSAGLLALMGSRSSMRWFTAAPAAAGLMLSLVRSAWGGCIVGLLLIIAWSPTKNIVKYLAALVVVATLSIPVVAFSPVGQRFVDRLETIVRLQEDTSFIARQELYLEYSDRLLTTVGGVGLGQSGAAGRLSSDSANSFAIDSGLIEIILLFGVAGLIMIGTIGVIALKSLPDRRSPEAIIAWSIAVSGCTGLLFGNTLVGVQGMLVLPFFALARRCSVAVASERSRLAPVRVEFQSFVQGVSSTTGSRFG